MTDRNMENGLEILELQKELAKAREEIEGLNKSLECILTYSESERGNSDYRAITDIARSALKGEVK